ncbi:39S ribosomal protein L2, mitochondrial [Toxorhynchites rutilus septentrionalis]|uniref:39S ribosomal protein L2, mitochondrial n=1 Tax=Toxorhynchites rutilus septentrionalis TaxID=329112 RepID=UPI00247AA56A|nr:39S ribosomal protein L2, mitochondrial [Toxorhynchites rutilus septentrionalis]
MMSLARLFLNLTIKSIPNDVQITQVCKISTESLSRVMNKPKPGLGKAYRRIVHYPETYSVKPLNVTNLAGRDPETGRLIAKGIGGGIKHKYHWIKWIRDGPAEGPPQVEKVIDVFDEGCRTAKIALVAFGNELKYILATENMKPGDLIKTSRFIPRIPVRANEGDAYPLGALQVGTQIHCLEKYPGQPCHLIHSAGTYGTIIRKFGDLVVVQLPSKQEFAFNQTCMATVGRVSNIHHNKTPIGSAQKNRELGNRPRSGLWQRKDGRHGRKIRKLPPMRLISAPKECASEPIKFTLKV